MSHLSESFTDFNFHIDLTVELFHYIIIFITHSHVAQFFLNKIVKYEGKAFFPDLLLRIGSRRKNLRTNNSVLRRQSESNIIDFLFI